MLEPGCIRGPFFLVKVEHLQSHLSKKNSADYLFKHKNHFNIAAAASNLHWREQNQENRKSLFIFPNVILYSIWFLVLFVLFILASVSAMNSYSLLVLLSFFLLFSSLVLPAGFSLLLYAACLSSCFRWGSVINAHQHFWFILWNFFWLSTVINRQNTL